MTLTLSSLNKHAVIGVGLAAALALSGCFSDDDDNGEQDALDGGSSDTSAFAELAGHWVGTGLDLFDEDIVAWHTSPVILSDGTIDRIEADGFVVEENLSPEVSQDRIFAYSDDEGERAYIHLVSETGRHAFGITLGGRPLVLEKEGVATSFQANAVVGDWAGEMFAVDDFPPRVVERRGDVTVAIDSQNMLTLNVPGLCEGITTAALELQQDQSSGANYWTTEELIASGEGSECPDTSDPEFVRVLMTPDESHIGLSICGDRHDADGGCGLFLLERGAA